MDDIVARIAHMARIEAYPQVSGKLRAALLNERDDAGEVLEAPAHLGSLARHGLEQHARALPLEHDVAERLGYALDAPLHPLPQMRARVKVVERAWKKLEPLEVLAHALERELPRALLRRA